ncbi:unnamed protein product [Schistosoma turkestanicum]|nr:unnamed protein product [Schistosoma turkestanicum]
MALDHCKNLAYYLLTTNYASYQNEKLKRLFNNISNNNKSDKTRNKSLPKHPYTTADITVDISLHGDNNYLLALSKHKQRKKHYNFLITMLKRDSLLPESLWNNVYDQLCDNFVHELNSSNRNHQFSSTSEFVNCVIQCLGRSFCLKHNIIQLINSGLSESFQHSNINNNSSVSKTASISLC